MNAPTPLTRIALFEAIPPAELDALAAHTATKGFPKNAIIINEGDATDALYVILVGRVKVFLLGENGREFILGGAGPGDYFGELALDGGPRSASVMTLEPTRCAIVPRTELQGFVARYPAVALTIMTNLSRRVRVLTENVRNLALLDVYGRVAHLLVESAGEGGELDLSQQDIADRVGASRQMVSRIMNDLLAGGYVARLGRRLTLLRRPPRAW
jgi:CRP/FNR family transcriptional regulator, cyclic AMP receptor protein